MWDEYEVSPPQPVNMDISILFDKARGCSKGVVRFRVLLLHLGRPSAAIIIAALQWQNGLTYDLQESFFLLGDLRGVELQAGGSIVLRAVEAGDVILEPLPECRLNDEACSGFADTDTARPDGKALE